MKLAIWDYLTVTYMDAKFRNFGGWRSKWTHNTCWLIIPAPIYPTPIILHSMLKLLSQRHTVMMVVLCNIVLILTIAHVWFSRCYIDLAATVNQILGYCNPLYSNTLVTQGVKLVCSHKGLMCHSISLTSSSRKWGQRRCWVLPRGTGHGWSSPGRCCPKCTARFHWGCWSGNERELTVWPKVLVQYCIAGLFRWYQALSIVSVTAACAASSWNGFGLPWDDTSDMAGSRHCRTDSSTTQTNKGLTLWTLSIYYTLIIL